jgi:SAM-dependent methyltransferase
VSSIEHVLQRLHVPARVTAPIIVVPDHEMRERERTSLNMLPDLSDWGPTSPLSERMRQLNAPVCVHRKFWEYAICVDGLFRLGAVVPEAKALAVGAGREHPLYYFANCIEQMIATDLYDGGFEFEAPPRMLETPAQYAPFPYREDHLSVLRMPGDKLDFQNAAFDFVFCLSSIEHFGSRTVQRRCLDEMVRVLRPGGFACITTELILTNHSHHEYFTWEEIRDIFMSHSQLKLVGGEPDLCISRSLVKYPTEIARNRNASPHIVLKSGRMLWTSLSMFFRKKT